MMEKRSQKTLEDNHAYFDNAYAEGVDIWNRVKERDAAFLNFMQSLRNKKEYGNLLDIGCGVARHADPTIRAGWSYTGIDYSHLAVEKAIENLSDEQASVIETNFFMFNPEKTFDALVDFGFLIHISKEVYPEYIAKIGQLSHPKSQLLLSVWSMGSKQMYGFTPTTSTRDFILPGPGGGNLYTRFFDEEDLIHMFGAQWEISNINRVSIGEESAKDAQGLEFLFVTLQKK